MRKTISCAVFRDEQSRGSRSFRHVGRNPGRAIPIIGGEGERHVQQECAAEGLSSGNSKLRFQLTGWLVGLATLPSL